MPKINTVEPWDGKDGVVSRENTVRVDGSPLLFSTPLFSFPQLPMEDDIDLSDVDLDDLEKDEL